MQEHQIGARVHRGRMSDLGPVRAAAVAEARGADIDDVEVVFDGFVGVDAGDVEVDGIEIKLLLGLLPGKAKEGDEERGGEREFHFEHSFVNCAWEYTGAEGVHHRTCSSPI